MARTAFSVLGLTLIIIAISPKYKADIEGSVVDSQSLHTKYIHSMSKSYMCSSQGNVLCFTIDFGSGFTCSEGTSKTVLWRYKFSQLKGSSDDGKTRVKLLFKNAESKQIDMKELEFANLTAVLHCIHSFIAAKVDSMDPLFVCSQNFSGNFMNS